MYIGGNESHYYGAFENRGHNNMFGTARWQARQNDGLIRCGEYRFLEATSPTGLRLDPGHR